MNCPVFFKIFNLIDTYFTGETDCLYAFSKTHSTPLVVQYTLGGVCSNVVSFLDFESHVLHLKHTNYIKQ